MKAKRIACLSLAAALLALSGCGDDDDTEFYPQILYRLEANGGGACFRMDHIASGRARHELEPGRVFTLAEGESRTFLLANGMPPFEARFDWIEAGCPDTSGVIAVIGFEVQGPSAEPRTLDAAQPTAILRLRSDVDNPVSLEIESPRVRFEVCSPLGDASECDGGPTGRTFTGNIGDAFISHLLSQLDSNDAATTPAVIFLENPRDRVSGIFRGIAEQRLRGELYIDDDFVDSSISDADVVLADDI